ncbi:hypothetical protein C7K43_12700 [Tetragenococcus koreensis]|nr:hypothetical protein C7K43_12700 [Tetragenococcus koreensis]
MAGKIVERNEKIIQNLKDSGFSLIQIEKFMTLYENKKTSPQRHIIINRRKALLDSIHQMQKQIDCLDYLLYRLEL